MLLLKCAHDHHCPSITPTVLIDRRFLYTPIPPSVARTDSYIMSFHM